MYGYTLHLDKYYTRIEFRQLVMSGFDWVERKLTNRNSCYNMFRVSPIIFYRLHDLLVEKYSFRSTTKCSSIEASFRNVS